MPSIDREKLVSQIKIQAMTVLMFTHSEPQYDLPQPELMEDLGSFAVVQLTLMLEDLYGVELLEEMVEFKGGSFEEFADFVIERVEGTKEKDTGVTN
ncbi:hypothetical protein [Nocardiopsis quinghaiensis]|uniref:hypothetical protein n=1 Tax=Nocardiopsis quinghaiensis TaxID=464995 RepID=UPI00123B759E|nr:hypothetical protein [Nocardiopsis quinghaiensis]